MARTGLQALEDAIAESSKGGGGFSGRLGYFNLKADESVVIRFLTDMPDIITSDFYEFIQDNKGKPQNFAVSTDYFDDPARPDYVKIFGGQQKDFGGNELTDPTPKTRTVALAVVREEVATRGDKGKPVITYKDAWTEVENKKGEKFEARQFIIVKQAYKNFWAPLVSFFHEYGTLCDRDYKIKRVGKGTDTSYSIMPKREDDDWDYEGDSSYRELQARYGYGTGKNAEGEDITPESPDRFAYVPTTLPEWFEDSCSEQRVKYFLGNVEDRDNQTAQAQQAKAETPAPGSLKSEDDEAQVAPSGFGGSSLQERLARHK